MTGEEFAVMLDFHLSAKFAPVLRHGANAMRTNRNDLLHTGSAEGFEVHFGELVEDEIVSEAACRVAGAALFLEYAETSSKMFHDAREGAHDLAPLRIVCSH